MKRWINRQPGIFSVVVLGIAPFICVLIIYATFSSARLAQNENDKLLPSFNSFGATVERYALTPDRRTGEYLLWKDTAASLKRLLLGVMISAVIALVVGVAAGSVPFVRAPVSPLITAFSLVPPMAILPILFIVFGLGELAKVVLIVIGITPFLIRDLQQRVMEIPREQIVKAQTLGGNSWQIVVRVILPQVIPRLLTAVRLSLGSAWLFLIAAEAIAATEGLGYRIFLVRRYLAMDVILPYVVWITLLAFMLEICLRRLSRSVFPWYHRELGS